MNRIKRGFAITIGLLLLCAVIIGCLVGMGYAMVGITTISLVVALLIGDDDDES